MVHGQMRAQLGSPGWQHPWAGSIPAQAPAEPQLGLTLRTRHLPQAGILCLELAFQHLQTQIHTIHGEMGNAVLSSCV